MDIWLAAREGHGFAWLEIRYEGTLPVLRIRQK